MVIPRTFQPVIAGAWIVSCFACARAPVTTSKADRGPGKTITAEMIAEYGVTNVWEILKKTGSFRTVRDDGPADVPNIRSRRGRTSFLLSYSDVPKVILDGARVFDLRLLREIPASSVERIQLLGAIEGTLYEGTNSGGGVILIVSKAGT